MRIESWTFGGKSKGRRRVIIWTDDGLFAGSHHDLDRLALLRNAARRRHTLIISTAPSDPWGRRSAPRLDSWLAGLPRRLRSEIKLLQQRLEIVSVTAVTRGAPRVLVCAEDPGPKHPGCRLSLVEAVRALSLPLYILVEHQLHDGAFLRRVLPPAWRARFVEWEQRGELRYENGCGLSGISALVEFHSDDDVALMAFGLPSEIWRLLHFVVFDHDGIQPDTPAPASGDLGRVCDKSRHGGPLVPIAPTGSGALPTDSRVDEDRHRQDHRS